jgi:hypothetical protein
VDSKTLVRKLIVWTVMATGVLALAGIIGVVSVHAWGAHRLTTVRSDFAARWGHIDRPEAPPEIPDHLNAARWLSAGGRAIVCSFEDMEFYSAISGVPARDWSAEDRIRAQRILADQHHALALLLQAGSIHRFQLGGNGAHARHHEINFLDMIRGLRLLVLEARNSWSEGRIDDSLAALDAVSNSADGLLRTPIVVSLAGGAAAQRWAARAAGDLVSDPCSSRESLLALSTLLPVEDPVRRGHETLARSLDEISDEGLRYIDDLHDPALGWSIPFWIPSRYLLEDLVVARILTNWSTFLELGRTPVSQWPPDSANAALRETDWPPWIVMGGTMTPNLLAVWARAQAASSEVQQLRIALELRLRSPDGLDAEACSLADLSRPVVLTGEPVRCRYDEAIDAITLEIPLATDALSDHLASDTDSVTLPPIVMPVGSRKAQCGGR